MRRETVASGPGGVVKLGITPACHAGGRGFKSRPPRYVSTENHKRFSEEEASCTKVAPRQPDSAPEEAPDEVAMAMVDAARDWCACHCPSHLRQHLLRLMQRLEQVSLTWPAIKR